MADRAVYRTRKDEDGDILALCSTGELWSPRLKVDAIADIEGGAHTYYVPLKSGKRAEIHVVVGQYGGKHLRTNWDGTTRNNLDDLEPC